MKIILVTPGGNIYKNFREFTIVKQPFSPPYTTDRVQATLTELKDSDPDFILQYYDTKLSKVLDTLEVNVGMVTWDIDAVESQVGACYLTRQQNPEHLQDSNVDIFDSNVDFAELFETIRCLQYNSESIASSRICTSDIEHSLRFFETIASL